MASKRASESMKAAARLKIIFNRTPPMYTEDRKALALAISLLEARALDAEAAR